MKNTLVKTSVIVLIVIIAGGILYKRNQDDVYLGAMNTVVYDYCSNLSKVFVIPVKFPKLYGPPDRIEIFSFGEKIAEAEVLNFIEKKMGLFYTYGVVHTTLNWEHDYENEISYKVDSISFVYDSDTYFFENLNIQMRVFTTSKEIYEPGHVTVMTMPGEDFAFSVSSSQKTEITGLGSFEEHLIDEIEFPIILDKDSSKEFKTDLKIDDLKFNVVGVYVDLTGGYVGRYRWWTPGGLLKSEYIRGIKK